MLSSLLFSLYFSSLLSFSFVTHPGGYCLLLLLSIFSISCVCYSFLGFSWYLVLLCLVYVGGIYVLFIYALLHKANSVPGGSVGFGYFVIIFLFFFFVCSVVENGGDVMIEESHYLCSSYDGLGYCFFCVVLLLGFSVIGVVCSRKDSFFR